MNSWFIIKELALSDFKTRYKTSYLAFFWLFINPLIVIMTLYYVFSIIMPMQIKSYQIFLLIGIIIWNFFSDATKSCMSSLTSKSGIIRKMRISKHLIVLSSVFLSGLNLIISLIILYLLCLFDGLDFTFASVMISIFFYVILVLITIGISLLLVGLYVIFKDIIHIWEMVLFIGFWLTPIIYSEMSVPLGYRALYMLNPLGRVIQHTRDALLNGYFSINQTIITIIITFIIVSIGIFVFWLNSKKMAEHL